MPACLLWVKQLMRVLGLDFGSKTTGVAVSDPLGFTAQGLETITREDENKLRRTCARIEELIREYQIETIEATNLTKCYELSSATGTSNVSEATIAKGTLLAAEEQQKYDVSFYRDVLTFNGNEGEPIQTRGISVRYPQKGIRH